MTIQQASAIYDERIREKFLSKTHISDEGCWPWLASFSTNGYGQMRVGNTMERAHRISYRLYKGDIPADTCVMHSCDNIKCVNPAHLSLGSIQDNIDDREQKRRGRRIHGSANAMSKLTDKEVWQIRDLYRSGHFNQQELADLYKVARNTVSQILMFKAWASSVNPYSPQEPQNAATR